MRARRFKTQADIDRSISQGFGQGEGAAYQPWWRVQDLPSRGRSRKVQGVKIERIHHVLSDLEYHYLILLEFSERVIDIREQYPVFPTEQAQKIALDLGITYPRFQSTSLLYVMTTDFLITYLDDEGQPKLAARTLKYDSELAEVKPAKRQRTLEKFELEKAILAAQGVTDWAIVTPELIGQTLARNLQWARAGAKLDRQFLRGETLARFFDILEFSFHRERPVSSMIRAAASAMHVPYVDSVNIFKYLIWCKGIRLDIRSFELHLTKPCPSLQFIGIPDMNGFMKAA